MASTYSTNLKIELMATGEKANTWGDITNTNLGTLLEQAISGYVSVAISDTDPAISLTMDPGTSCNARNMYLVLTGTLTTTRSVVVPNNAKLYFIHNSTTGGQSVIVKTSGGTGVTVTNGSKALLMCTGTNVIAGITNVATSGNAVLAGDNAGGFTNVSPGAGIKFNTTGAILSALPRVTSNTVSTTPYTQTWSSASTDQLEVSITATSAVTVDIDGNTTPTDGQKAIFRLTSSANSVTVTFAATGTRCFKAIGVPLPSSTALANGSVMYVGAIYNSGSSTWDVVAVNQV